MSVFLRAHAYLSLLIFTALSVAIPFQGNTGEQKRLTLLRAYTQPNLRGREPHGFSWSRDDKFVAYAWNEKGWSFNEIWVMDVSSGEKWRVSDLESIQLAEAREANMEVKEVEDRKTDKELVEDVHRYGGAGSPTWGSDGMLYVPWAGDIWRLSPDKPVSRADGQLEYAAPDLFLNLQGWVGGLSFSDDGTQLGFQYENCYWVYDLRKGSLREVAQGSGGRGQGSFNWSPDGRFIAFSRVDSSGLRQINLVDFIPDNIASWPVNRARPGDMIDRVQIGIADMARTGRKRNDPRMLKLGDSEEVYVYDMRWSPSGRYLMIGMLSKDTRSYDIYIAEPASGRTARVWSETDEAWYNRTTGPQWLGDDSIVLCSEKDGWGHLYRLDISSWSFPPESESKPEYSAGKEAKTEAESDKGKDKGKELVPDGIAKPFVPTLPAAVQLTSGDYEVTQLYIPQGGSVIYFVSSQGGPDRRDLYSMPPSGGRINRLTSGLGVSNIAGWYRERGGPINWAEDKAIVSSSTPERGPFYNIVDLISGKQTCAILRDHPTEFYSYRWVTPESVRIQNEKDGEYFSARVFRPAYAQAGEKRPVIVYVHGAGYAQTALRSYDWLDAVSMYMADTLGYIVVDIDYRGSSGYGRKWRTDVFHKLGELEVSDAESAAHYFIKSGEGDAGCVGIWGWSYGGFLTNMAMFRTPETFKAGVSVAAVSKWWNYNSWYVSERLGDPQQNKDAYKRSDPIEYAGGLQGQLLMVHGIRDDNVLFQDFAQLTKKLLDAGKHVDMMVYPEMGHGPASDENMVHIAETVSWYFLKHFGLGAGAQGPDPKDSLETYLARKKLDREAIKKQEAADL